MDLDSHERYNGDVQEWVNEETQALKAAGIAIVECVDLIQEHASCIILSTESFRDFIKATAQPKGIQEWQVLRPDGENAWARLIGRVLSTFFDGTEPPIARLQLQKYDDALPVELVECFATCFWAIQAAWRTYASRLA